MTRSFKIAIVFTLFLGVSSVNAQFFKKLKKVLDKPLIKPSSEKIPDEELEKVKFPDIGVLNSESELLEVATQGLNTYFGKTSMINIKQYITSNKWSTVKHKVTGVPLYQWAVGAVIQKNKNGECMLQQFILRKDYTGGGKYSKPYFNGISLTGGAPYGSYCKCKTD